MAKPDPTGRGNAVALTIQPCHRRFLQELFETLRDGLLGDLADHSGRLRDPEHSRREADGYARLLTALSTGVIVSDRQLCAMVAERGRANDEENEFERVVFEHEAFQALLAQLASATAEER